jgi:hypothetical protein
MMICPIHNCELINDRCPYCENARDDYDETVLTIFDSINERLIQRLGYKQGEAFVVPNPNSLLACLFLVLCEMIRDRPDHSPEFSTHDEPEIIDRIAAHMAHLRRSN